MGQGNKRPEPNDARSELENVGRQLRKVEDTEDGRPTVASVLDGNQNLSASHKLN